MSPRYIDAPTERESIVEGMTRVAEPDELLSMLHMVWAEVSMRINNAIERGDLVYADAVRRRAARYFKSPIIP